MADKIDIEYASFKTQDHQGPWTVYLFYPYGVWDEDKLSLKEAETLYPKKKYNWVKVDR
jgi:hypothetical protein